MKQIIYEIFRGMKCYFFMLLFLMTMIFEDRNKYDVIDDYNYVVGSDLTFIEGIIYYLTDPS